MYCTNCGAEIANDALFCTNCGTKLPKAREDDAPSADETVILDEVATEGDAAQETAAIEGIASAVEQPTTVIATPGAPQPTTVMDEVIATIPADQSIPPSAFEPSSTRHMPRVQQPVANAGRKGSGKKVAIIVAIVCVIVIAAAIIGYFAYTQAKAHQESHEPIPVEFTFSYSGERAEQPIGVPLLVQGTDLDGSAVEQQVLATAEGGSLELLAGSYAISVAGDPVSANGIVYQVQGAGTQELEIPVPSDEGVQPVIPDLDFSFAPEAADKVTDQQVSAIESWMTTFGVSPDDIQHISGAIVNRRNAEVARTTLEKEKEAALAANPSVLPMSSQIGLTIAASLTGTVRVAYFEVGPESYARGNVCYLELPRDVQITGFPNSNPKSNRIVLPSSFASYKDKVITISDQYTVEDAIVIKEAACSPIHAENPSVVRVFE